MEATTELKQAVRECREGKTEAFTRLYEESSKYIYTCIYNAMRGNDNVEDAVCDIMQDTYVEISRSITKLDNEDSFLSWAAKIAVRKCYAWLKKNKKYVLLQEEDDTLENLAEDDNIIPESVMQDREKQRLVREIIETRLTEMQKLCIIAYYYNEQKQSEIAQELGIPENTVKTNLSRAKARIKTGVLELEEKEGTRLYSVAPFLLLLFNEDVLACTVPASVTAAVNSSVTAAVSAAGGAGSKTLLAKLAGASAKAKITAAVVGAGVVITVGTAAYVAMQDKEEPWETRFREILLEEDQAAGFDLNDFDGDGIPEMVLLKENGDIDLYRYREVKKPFCIIHASEKIEGSEDNVLLEHICGYDMEYDTLIDMQKVSISFENGMTDYTLFPVYKQYADGKMISSGMTSWGHTINIYPVTWHYYWDEGAGAYDISEEKAMEYIADAQGRFNEIQYTDITKEDMKKRFAEFKEKGNRERIRNSVETAVGSDSQAPGTALDGETIELSDDECRDIEELAGMLSLNSYFFGEDMYGGRYPVDDIAVNMKLIDIIGNMSLQDQSLDKYLPPTEKDALTLIRYCMPEDVQNYLKNVFGIENADISAYCEGDRAVFDLVGDYILKDAFPDSAVLMPDGSCKITGTFSLWLATDLLEAAYPYELTVIRNPESPFGFQVLSMEFGEEITEDYEEPEQTPGDASLRDILLNRLGNSAWYPGDVEYGTLYFALLDIDQDGEEEIVLGTSKEPDYFGKPCWITIFNILKYDKDTGEVSDFDGDKVYRPLDADSWYYYDNGVLMTMVQMNYGHTYFWNLLTGEFTEADRWYPDNPEKSYESEGHSRIYNADGTEITGEEGDRYYQSLKSGNEVYIVWYEAEWGNVEALTTGGELEPAYIPTPFGEYKANRGAELFFYSDGTVLVSEGNSSTKCAFTVDREGKLVIDPDGEAIEGTYDALADEIRIYALKFRR